MEYEQKQKYQAYATKFYGAGERLTAEKFDSQHPENSIDLAYFNMIDFISEQFCSDKITGSFKDALQEAYFVAANFCGTEECKACNNFNSYISSLQEYTLKCLQEAKLVRSEEDNLIMSHPYIQQPTYELSMA